MGIPKSHWITFTDSRGRVETGLAMGLETKNTPVYVHLHLIEASKLTKEIENERAREGKTYYHKLVLNVT